MNRPYEAHAYSGAPRAGCFWPAAAGDWPALDHEAHTDIAVIGAGYTGLSAALHLARAGEEVTVLDAESPGWGASGRNGGFCCLGGAKAGHATLARRFGEAQARLWFDAQRAAVDLVADLLHRHDIDADTHSDGEVELAHTPRRLKGLRVAAAELQGLGIDARLLAREELAERGLNGPGFQGGLRTPVGFALNPGKYAQGLADAATRAGARLHGHSPVTGIARANGRYCLTTPQGRLSARRLILATNGYSSDDLPGWMRARFLPVQSNIILTRPLSPGEQAAQGWTSDLMAFDSRTLLHYFRLMPDGRFLFGMRGGVRADARAQAAMRTRIRRDFDTMFPAWSHVETPHFWSGLACLAPGMIPYVGPVGDWPGAWAGFAWHGNGVAMGTYAGARLAELASGRPAAGPFPGFLSRPVRPYPLARLRRLGLAAAYLAYGLSDRF